MSEDSPDDFLFKAGARTPEWEKNEDDPEEPTSNEGDKDSLSRRIEEVKDLSPGVEIEAKSEMDKVRIAREECASQEIGEFLSWLRRSGISFSVPHPTADFHVPVHFSTKELLSAYFGVDQNKREKEMSSLLEEVRELNDQKE